MALSICVRSRLTDIARVLASSPLLQATIIEILWEKPTFLCIAAVIAIMSHYCVTLKKDHWKKGQTRSNACICLLTYCITTRQSPQMLLLSYLRALHLGYTLVLSKGVAKFSVCAINTINICRRGIMRRARFEQMSCLRQYKGVRLPPKWLHVFIFVRGSILHAKRDPKDKDCFQG